MRPTFSPLVPLALLFIACGSTAPTPDGVGSDPGGPVAAAPADPAFARLPAGAAGLIVLRPATGADPSAIRAALQTAFAGRGILDCMFDVTSRVERLVLAIYPSETPDAVTYLRGPDLRTAFDACVWDAARTAHLELETTDDHGVTGYRVGHGPTKEVVWFGRDEVMLGKSRDPGRARSYLDDQHALARDPRLGALLAGADTSGPAWIAIDLLAKTQFEKVMPIAGASRALVTIVAEGPLVADVTLDFTSAEAAATFRGEASDAIKEIFAGATAQDMKDLSVVATTQGATTHLHLSVTHQGLTPMLRDATDAPKALLQALRLSSIVGYTAPLMFALTRDFGIDLRAPDEVLVEMFVHGGACPGGECHKRVTVRKNGEVSFDLLGSNGAEKAVRHQTAEIIAELDRAIAEAPWSSLISPDTAFHGVCPTIVGGKETIFTFHLAGGGTRVVSDCAYQVDFMQKVYFASSHAMMSAQP